MVKNQITEGVNNGKGPYCFEIKVKIRIPSKETTLGVITPFVLPLIKGVKDKL